MTSPIVLRIGDAIMNERTKIPGRVGFLATSRFDPGLVWIVSCSSVLDRPCGEWPETGHREPIVRVNDQTPSGRPQAVAFLDKQHVEPDPGVAAALVHPDLRVRLDLSGLERARAATTPKKGMVVVCPRGGAQPLEGVVEHADEENVEVAPRAGWGAATSSASLGRHCSVRIAQIRPTFPPPQRRAA